MPDLLRAGADEALACCWGMEINPLPREAVLIVNVHSRKGFIGSCPQQIGHCGR
jgi:hypothetical protein